MGNQKKKKKNLSQQWNKLTKFNQNQIWHIPIWQNPNFQNQNLTHNKEPQVNQKQRRN